MAMSTSLTSSSSDNQWTYDVFLSFRGKDTRSHFTGHLYKALSKEGINTFIDDENLRKGEEITPALIKADKESRIAIVIFSEDFASSRFCLDELVLIMDCLEGIDNYEVLPVFYKVTPANVRYQKESFEEGLAKHETRISGNGKAKKWRSALEKAANISGWNSEDYRQDYKLIEDIVEKVSEIINDPTLDSGVTFKGSAAAVATMAMPTSLSSSSYAKQWTLDVFLNFRGMDTRNFAGNLYKALFEKGISTFMDDENLMKGEEIAQAAIKESEIAIVIFSKNYASSRFCLDELVMIMDCLERIEDYKVLTVFYEVTPADVLHQIGTVENALAKHETRISENGKVQKWKSALKQAANRRGWVSEEYGQEYELMEDLVREVNWQFIGPTLGSRPNFKQKVHCHDDHQSVANSPVMFGTSVQFSGLQTSPSASSFGAQSSCGPGFGATHPLYNVDIPMVTQFFPSTNVPNLGPQSSFNAFQCPICLNWHHPNNGCLPNNGHLPF